jgi:competence protein ComGC
LGDKPLPRKEEMKTYNVKRTIIEYYQIDANSKNEAKEKLHREGSIANKIEIKSEKYQLIKTKQTA